MIERWWLLALLAWALVATLMLALWLVQLRTRNATAVDAGWAASLTLIAILDGVLGNGRLEHRLLIALVAGIECARVACIVIRRLGGAEDGRYQELRARWREREREQTSFFVFYQAQGLLAVILSAPLLAASYNHRHGLQVLEWIGAALWLLAVPLEQLADSQLARFRSNPANKGRTMRAGLWHYSRHPNYFFQWLTWVAYALIALAAPYGWAGLLSPALMLVLILHVTGIPPTEEQAIKSRGEDYRRYQRETSAFVPWFPKAGARLIHAP